MSATAREIHYGIVVDNADPEQRGRLLVQCDTLAADGGTWPDFIDPVFPYLGSSDGERSSAGWFFIPDVGVVVELEVTTQSPRDETSGSISVDAPDIRWRACIFAEGADETPIEFAGDNYPNRRGIQTAAGHALVFDDTAGDPEVKLQQVVDETGAVTFLDFDDVGSAFITTSKGHMLYLNQSDLAPGVSLIDAIGQNMLVMNAEGWYISTAESDMVKAIGGEVSIFTANMLINASGVTANVGGFAVSQFGLETPVLVDGLLGFQTMLSAVLAEIKVGLAAVPVPTVLTPSIDALVIALGSSSFAATLLTSE